MASLVHRVHPGTPIVHYDSGFDFPETQRYLSQTAAAHGWNYQPIRVGSALDAMVANASWDHDAQPDPDGLTWWDVICARPASIASERYGPAMAWGLRAEESSRRRSYAQYNGRVFTRADGVTVLSPILWWATTDVWACHRAHEIKPNPIYQRLADLGVPAESRRVSLLVSSDGLGGGRAMWLRRGWPDVWQRLAEALPRLREYS